MPKGWPLGRKRGPRPEADRRAIADGQCRRWELDEGHRKGRLATQMSWEFGALRVHRVLWTEDMDSMLRTLHAQMNYRQLRTVGAKRIGVSDAVLRDRLAFLGLRRSRLLQNSKNDGATVSRRRGADQARGAHGAKIVPKQKGAPKEKQAKIRSLDALYRSLGLK